VIRYDYSFFNKAAESIAGAESEFVNGRYNNCANRCYYACFQAEIVALQIAGIRPRRDQWGHEFVAAQFNGEIIYRRKLYPTELRSVLERNFALRQKGDYHEDLVTQTEANRALGRTRSFIQAIRERGGETA
jgi:uncharacterized protein (UPF0332 family)